MDTDTVIRHFGISWLFGTAAVVAGAFFMLTAQPAEAANQNARSFGV